MIRLAIPCQRRQKLSKVSTLRAGQSYERRASAWLEQEYGMLSQVEFERVGYGRFIPDGLMFSHDYKKLVVVEIKTQHSRLGEQQLKNYVSWLSSWFPGPVSGLEVCSIMHPNSTKWEWELVPTPKTAFYLPFCIFAISSRSLPRMDRRGLGMDKSASSNAVPASGSVRSSVDRSMWRTDVASSS